MHFISFGSALAGSLIGAALFAGCISSADPTDVARVEHDPRTTLATAIEHTRTVTASVDFRATVVIDGVIESEFSAVGRVDGVGGDFEFEITAPSGAGLAADVDHPLTVRRVGDRIFQRGVVLTQFFPEVGDRWLEMIVEESVVSSPAAGLIGPDGFTALDLLVDLDSVTSPEPDRYAGTLGEVRIDGGRIGQSDETTFEAEVTNGVVTSFRVSLRSDSGVELIFTSSWDVDTIDFLISPPEAAEIYTP